MQPFHSASQALLHRRVFTSHHSSLLWFTEQAAIVSGGAIVDCLTGAYLDGQEIGFKLTNKPLNLHSSLFTVQNQTASSDRGALNQRMSHAIRTNRAPLPQISTQPQVLTHEPNAKDFSQSPCNRSAFQHHNAGNQTSRRAFGHSGELEWHRATTTRAGSRRSSLRADTSRIPTPDGGLRPAAWTNRSLSLVQSGIRLRRALIPLTRSMHLAEEPDNLSHSATRPESAERHLSNER
ncbi:hypothetical protein IWX90DRAFT_188491 [Phyllosticta citrichinensis]|uniref:Uncharacterized protein n=1 Tax=Phyllosticta citrichinensis TaxID=1130410 RepID=A0ABR1XWN3_9PEZI